MGAAIPLRILQFMAFLLLFAASAWVSASVENNVNIGVLAFQGKHQAVSNWQATADYLSEQIEGYRFNIVPVTNDDIDEALNRRQIDFVLTNPGSYVAHKERHDINRILTLLRSSDAGSLGRFGAVIVVRDDRQDMQTVSDVRGKRFAAVHENAFGGWWMAALHLKHTGIEARDLDELRFTGFPQTSVLDAVISGQVDAGTVRTGQLERFLRSGRKQAGELRVLQPQGVPNFPYVVTTQLYPEWPLAVVPGVPPTLSSQVARELLGLRADDEPNRSAGISGWTVPLDYGSVRNLMQELRVGPYQTLGSLTVEQLFSDLGRDLLIAVIVGLTGFVLILMYFNRRISTAQLYISDILHSIDDAVLRLDNRGHVEFLNPMGESLSGVETRSAAKQHYRRLFSLQQPNGDSLTDIEYEALLSQQKKSQHLVLRDVRGREHPVNITVSAMYSVLGTVSGYVVVIHDVSELHNMASKLSFQASHDWLTGLNNRRHFEEQLMLIHEDETAPSREHVLCYLDLDHFKVVNDSGGHLAGDEMLKRVADLLRENIRQADVLARLGGDEFGFVLKNCGMPKAREIGEHICQSMRNTRFEWNREVFSMSGSLGLVALASNEVPLSLMRYADAACYIAKKEGGSRVHVYDVADNRLHQHHDEMAWVRRVSMALEHGEFVLYAQPILRLKQGLRLLRYEVLLRLKNASGGLTLPDEFLPAAEQYRMSPQIDRWVIRQTFTFLAERKDLLAEHGTVFSINLSALSLTDDGFLDYLSSCLVEFEVQPDSVCFEITETATTANFESAVELVQGIKQLGCRLALDDFGSGHSSFTYLRRLPVDYLKIDGSFVRDAMQDAVSAAMVKSALQVGRAMGIETVAEYCETDILLSWLQDIGVDHVQGYAIGKPFPLEQVPTAYGDGNGAALVREH